MSDAPNFIDPVTKQEYRVGGCLVSKEPSKLPLFGAPQQFMQNLPPSVDLRRLMTPVEHQGSTNSCVPNALAGAYEFLIKKNTGQHVDFSRLFIYYNGRLKSGFSEYNLSDSGCYISGAVEALREFGCCMERMFDFNNQNVNRRPSNQCFQEARKYRTTDANAVPVNTRAMKACLAEGYPFVFGMYTYPSFNAAGTNGGRVAMPDPRYEQLNAQHGAHSMLAVGYSDASRCFIVRNSWGPNWGDRGYCYIPYEYLGNPRFAMDAHVIKSLSSNNEPQSITNAPVDTAPSWPSYNNNQYAFPNNVRNYYENTYFWVQYDNFNYMNALWRDGRLEPSTSNEPATVILWIDEMNAENSQVEEELRKNNNVTFVYREKFSEAENYLVENKKELQSSPFQIICRGFYKDGKKNPLDLLSLLDYLGYKQVPVLVFTGNKVDLEQHLEVSAKDLKIKDWKKRLFITQIGAELLNALEGNLKKKSA